MKPVTRCGLTHSKSGKLFTVQSAGQHELDCLTCQQIFLAAHELQEAHDEETEYMPSMDSYGYYLADDDMPDGAYWALLSEGEWD